MPGPHVFAVRVCAVRLRAGRSLTGNPPCDQPLRADASASTASHRAFRDDREPPLLSGETRGVKSLICPTRQADNFSREVWTGQITLKSQTNFDFSRTRSAGQFSLEGGLGRA